MGLFANIAKKYYRSKGYEIAFRKYRIPDGPYPQDIIMPRSTFAPWTTDEAFKKIYNAVRQRTLVDIYRCYELWQLAKEVSALPGDYIEVGAWKGGTAAIIAAAANQHTPESHIYVCDTFTGVVKAGEHDNKYTGGEHADTSVEEVEQFLTGAGLRQVTLLEGMFPDDTAAQIEDRAFKFCHIDVDVYEGAKQITEWIWGRLCPGGVIVYDDYGFSGTQGVTKFIEESREQGDRIILHNLNGHAIMIKI